MDSALLASISSIVPINKPMDLRLLDTLYSIIEMKASQTLSSLAHYTLCKQMLALWKKKRHIKKYEYIVRKWVKDTAEQMGCPFRYMMFYKMPVQAFIESYIKEYERQWIREMMYKILEKQLENGPILEERVYLLDDNDLTMPNKIRYYVSSGSKEKALLEKSRLISKCRIFHPTMLTV